ncbi:MAG: hypothetical protein II891_04380 [Bacteroidales bacterium]|nr:hypothetical protein [Bacteroidales bacterium]
MRTAFPAILLTLCACSAATKVEAVRDGVLAPSLSVAEDLPPADLLATDPVSDTIQVTDAQGRSMLLMRAVRDENGEMVASDVISPVVVAARFRNVAERHGRVTLRFDVRVPSGMVESGWQLRLFPILRVGEESSSLSPVYITGQKYRRAQLRGYERYERFLESIVSDSTLFIRTGQLEIFLRRNMPELWALRTDSSYVSDERFASIYGVTEQQAVQHYTDHFRKSLNRRREARREKVFARYVKAPIPVGLQLDTVIAEASGEMIYTYSHELRTKPGQRKAEIFLKGTLHDEDGELCILPGGEPLVFYISSLNGLVEERERYLLKITSRLVRADGECRLEFSAGSASLDTSLGRNSMEIKRITAALEELLEDSDYAMDSIVVAATCSPEGSWRFNSALSRRRSQAVCDWYSGLRNRDTVSLEFIPRAVPENWDGLWAEVTADTLIPELEKQRVESLRDVRDPDRRERLLAGMSCYRYVREYLYPHLRVVNFRFYRHRRGMIQDTLVTTVPDTVYAAGLRALRDCDYKKAAALLAQYSDINSAVAFCAADMNASAMHVLDNLPISAREEYIRALVHARRGEERKAVEAYCRACELDPTYVHRGNLDPEISGLKKKYETVDIQ